MTLSRRRLGLASLATLALAACDDSVPGGETLTSKAYILVDLSETWLNAASRDRNRAVLMEIGQGLALFAQTADPPVEFQYRAIGASAFGKPPLKVLRFQGSVTGRKPSDPPYLIRNFKTLRNMLGYDCVDGLLALPPERETEIEPVLASIAKRPDAPTTRRSIIVASDLREEMAGEAASLPDLTGFKVLLAYRPVEDDLLNRRQVDNRVSYWRELLSTRGAVVHDMLDADLKRDDIFHFLTGKFDERAD